MPLRTVSGAARAVACRLRAGLLLVGLLALAARPSQAQTRVAALSAAPVAETSVRALIHAIEARTDYRFLYRDALLTGKRVAIAPEGDDVMDRLGAALGPLGLTLQVDEARRQVLVVPTRTALEATPSLLGGYVLDADTGARLPFATVTWRDGDRLQGVAADVYGTFHLSRAVLLADAPRRTLTVSYVGYRTRTVTLFADALPRELSVRLEPEPLAGHEVVVRSTLLDSEVDTTWHHLLRPDRHAPLGEGSVIRALQALPAVTLSPALAEGLNVRGSRADGFQVLLDGVTIYNQNHLFGLFDAFNEDALQAVGFYYGVTPAAFQAPPGGTLSFVTRTGSQRAPGLSIGVSNTALRGTAEGPLWGGRASWLLSGRHSYLNTLDWFNNAELVALGLDTGITVRFPHDAAGRRERALFPGTASARFYDLHGKLTAEGDDGGRLMLSAYLGGDHAAYQATGFLLGADTEPGERRALDTVNDWGNAVVSLHARRPLGPAGTSQTLLGLSHYTSRFEKDDFLYQIVLPRPGQLPEVERANAGFANDNTLLEWKLAQEISLAAPGHGLLNVGAALHHYSVEYAEASLLRRRYHATRRSALADVFAEYTLRSVETLEIQAGLRTHYFSDGAFFRLSPRFRLTLRPGRPVSLGLGYSRNHQFLHRLSLEHLTTAAGIWTLSSTDEPPGSVDHLTAGLYVRRPQWGFQAEAYYKRFDNLRLHETRVARRNLATGSLLLAPWIHDNHGEARGLELLLRHATGPLRWTHSYTLSRMEISNPRLDHGVPFRADWDRTHQFMSRVELPMGRWVRGEFAWHYGSGTPNTLYGLYPGEPEMLPVYHRLDLGLETRFMVDATRITARFALFNAYDRDNAWYRKSLPVIVARPERTLRFVNVDVNDLGLQPSFELTLTF